MQKLTKSWGGYAQAEDKKSVGNHGVFQETTNLNKWPSARVAYLAARRDRDLSRLGIIG